MLQPCAYSGKAPPRSDAFLSIWALCQFPSDFPGEFVAREHRVILGTGQVVATQNVVRSIDKAEVRAELYRLGKVPTRPDPQDDPVIIEVWL